MSKRPSSETRPSQAKRTKLSNAAPNLPPRNSFRGLPLELRDQIYTHVFEDLVTAPQHPYSEMPLNSRFEDYMALLLVDKATSDEAKRLFSKSYVQQVVFYFEDACSLFDLHRRWESESFPFDLRFVLRTRSDLDPKMELDDGIQWMNDSFFYNPDHGTDQPYMDHMGLTGFQLRDGEVLSLNGLPLEPDFMVADSDHTRCGQKGQCIPYKSVSFPPYENSLRAEAAVWKMETSSRWNVDRQQMVRTTDDVGVTLFHGKLCDISFSGFPLSDAKLRLIGILKDCTWPSFLARYEGKYPLDEEEFQDFLDGEVEFDWPITDITEGTSGLDEEEDEDDDDDDDDSDLDEEEDDDDGLELYDF